METIKVDCVYKEQTSKDNKTYKCCSIRLSDDYEKRVFLTVPEQLLLEKTYQDELEKNPYNF